MRARSCNACDGKSSSARQAFHAVAGRFPSLDDDEADAGFDADIGVAILSQAID